MNLITFSPNEEVNVSSPAINNTKHYIDTYKLGLIILTFFFLFWNYQAHATHVIGGGITYTKLENDNYLLQVKLYRDCTPGTAQLPGNVNVLCRRGNDGSNPGNYGSHVLPLISATQLQPDVPACAFDPGICVQEAIYEDIVTIPDGPGGYHLYYTICCRNATILNITNPLNARETFYAYIPEQSVLQPAPNSSPSFNDVPPVYVCANQPLDLSFQAQDPDGDSLVYYFYTPYDGNNGGGITYGAGNPPNNINISPVNWVNGFGATDPLDGAPGLLPGLQIDNNGFITGTPPAQGQYVVGVMVDEYRNGQLIGRISRDFQFNVINCPPPLDAIIDAPDLCNGLNVDFLNQSTGNFTTSWWDFGTGNPADSSLLFQPTFNYTQAGTYTVTLIIEKGTDCADTATFDITIMDPVNFNLAIDSVSCFTFADGQAEATANDPNYTYDWSTSETGSIIQNLAPAAYWVYATNDIGCVDTQFFNVFEPNDLQNNFNVTEPLCNGDQNGSCEALTTGGTAPYTYFWPQENFNGNPLQNIGVGSYQVQITDANGCFMSDQAIVMQPPPVAVFIDNVQNVSCHGANDGSINVSIAGGTPGYNIDWLTLPNDSTYMNNLGPGTYIAEVTDANNCMEIINITITEPDTFFVDIVVINEETCTGSNGEAFADVTGGIGNINYLWNPGGSTNELATGLSAGPIQVVVQDENGCMDQANGVIVDHPTGTASAGNVTPVSCQNGNDGSFEVLMNGGTAPFSYSWSCNCPDQNVANNLSAGNYWVAVEDDNGCIDSLDFTINELPPLEVQPILLVAPSCNGTSDGSIEAEAIGGTVPYNFAWNSNPPQFTAIASNLPAGTFTVTVTDNNGCQAQTSAQLVDPPVLTVQADVLGNIICYGDSSGIAQAQGIGGTPPYGYLWSNNETTAIIDNLLAGSFDVTVTDDNGCQSFGNVEIIEYDSVFAEITYDDGFCPGDTVDFYVNTNGLNNLYDYMWFVDHILQGTDNTFSYVIDDTSNITIVLVNIGNCPSVVDSTDVGPIMMQPNNVTAYATPDTICYGSTADLSAVINDTSFVTSIQWNFPELNGLGPHTVAPEGQTDYIITIENVCGEQQSDNALVNVFMPPTTQLFAEGIEGCERVEIDFSYAYDQNYAYQFEGGYWNILGDQYNELNPHLVLDYSVNANASLFLAFSNGCIFEFDTIIPVTVYDNPEGDFYYNPDPAKEDEVTEFIDITYGNTQGWEWYVDGNFLSTDERPSYVFDEAGEYEVTQIVYDENGCYDTTVHIIEVIGSYTVWVPNAFTPDGDGRNNEFKPVVTNIDPDKYRFMIFDRWGEIIFDTEIVDQSWDGRYLGDIVRDGVYIWKVLVTDNVGIEHEYVGHVTLLR